MHILILLYVFIKPGRLDEESGQIMHWKYGPPVIKPYYTIDDLLEHSNFIPTCSVMFRNGLLGKFPDWYFKSEIGELSAPYYERTAW